MPWTLDTACAALAGAGVVVAPSDVRLEPRELRHVAHLPGDRIAWFADTETGRRRLVLERRVLRLLEARCSFRVPRVLYEADDGAFDVRAAVPGAMDPRSLFARAKADDALAARVGRDIGAILVEQHTRIGAADVAGWLPVRTPWPEPGDSLRERLPRVVADPELLARTVALVARYEAVVVEDGDRALVHGDLGFHNIAVDPETSAVRGVFDWEDAAWADRHHDFRYLLFDVEHDAMLEGALAVYEPAVGRRMSRERIALYNAACAVGFLAYRDGVAAEERWCGRTLAEDLGWTRMAMGRVGM
jgi:aminoglycoside phosphotransferase (APT) family kinase protein